MFTRAQKGGHSSRKGIPPKSRSHDSLQARQVAQARWVHLAKRDYNKFYPTQHTTWAEEIYVCVGYGGDS
jgi:expansin (peptidoglycan-binding protein)